MKIKVKKVKFEKGMKFENGVNLYVSPIQKLFLKLILVNEITKQKGLTKMELQNLYDKLVT